MSEQLTATLAPTLKVVVSEDRLKAWVEVLGMGTAQFVPPQAADVVAALEQARLAVTDAVRARAEEVAAAVRAAATAEGARPPERYLVAEGRAAVDAVDGRFEWTAELASQRAPPEADERIDYFSLNSIVTVTAGTVIGRIVPPQEGVSSIDVYGQERPPRKPKGVPIRVGAGARLKAEGSDEVVAEVDGRVAVERGVVRVSEVLDITGDVDFASGSVDACVDVTVRGTVRSNFHVHTAKALLVDRVIEAADVRAGGDIFVRGGIFGQLGAGKVEAGGTVTVRLLNEVDLRAGGDVQFVKEVLNSRVHTQGRLFGPRGTIIGGQVYAREGLEVRVLGSEACVATAVAAGIEVETLQGVRQLERQVREAQKSADQIRKAVQPLMANLKRLLPAQRERATELLCKADEVELQLDEMKREIARRLKEGSARGRPSVLVGDAIYPGVSITIDGRIVQIQRLLHGPVRVELRKVDAVTEVVAVNQRTGSVTVLQSVEAELDPPAESEQKGARGDGADGQAARRARA